MSEQDFVKIVCPGFGVTHGGRSFRTYCRITFKDGELTINGVEGPLVSGGALGSCGQIQDSLKRGIVKYSPGWTRAKVRKFAERWRRWHLNYTTAGSPRQEQFLREASHPPKYYGERCKLLSEAGLNPDKTYAGGYNYGASWLKVEVPTKELDWLKALPDADTAPAWI